VVAQTLKEEDMMTTSSLLSFQITFIIRHFDQEVEVPAATAATASAPRH